MGTLKTELINHLPDACLEELEVQILFLQELITENFPLYVVQSTKTIHLSIRKANDEVRRAV